MQVCLDMQSDIQISEPVVTPQGIGGKCDIILMLNWTKRSFNSDLRKSFWKDYGNVKSCPSGQPRLSGCFFTGWLLSPRGFGESRLTFQNWLCCSKSVKINWINMIHKISYHELDEMTWIKKHIKNWTIYCNVNKVFLYPHCLYLIVTVFCCQSTWAQSCEMFSKSWWHHVKNWIHPMI